MTYIDDQIGRLLDYLDRSGLRENTLVIFTSDHGDNLGEHGGLLDKGFVHFESTHRIPLLMRGPGVPAERRDELVSLVDIYPTVLDAAGVACPEGRHGRSLLDRSAPPRDSIVVEFHGLNEVTLSMRTIRSGMRKYGWTACGGDEFYDLSSDPFETNNRSHDPAVQGDVRAFRQKLLEWMRETDDPLARQYERLMRG